MSAALGGMVGSAAILGLGAMLPAQSSLLASTSLMGSRLAEKARKSSAPVPIAINAAAADCGAAEACALVVGLATSPPRTAGSLMGTRRVLAPSYCLSKTRRRRQPSNGGGDGSESDEGQGGSGGDDGGFGGGGCGGGDDSWGEEERGGGALIDCLCLWQALCLFSVLQVLHYIASNARPRDEARVSALASLTHSLYNSRRLGLAAAV